MSNFTAVCIDNSFQNINKYLGLEKIVYFEL